MKEVFKRPMSMYLRLQLMFGVKLHNLAVVNSKEFVKPRNHCFFAAFPFAAFLLNKVIDSIVGRFVFD